MMLPNGESTAGIFGCQQALVRKPHGPCDAIANGTPAPSAGVSAALIRILARAMLASRLDPKLRQASLDDGPDPEQQAVDGTGGEAGWDVAVGGVRGE